MPSPFWARHADRRGLLLARARITAALREFFAAREFLEVETATLVAKTQYRTRKVPAARVIGMRKPGR